MGQQQHLAAGLGCGDQPVRSRLGPDLRLGAGFAALAIAEPPGGAGDDAPGARADLEAVGKGRGREGEASRTIGMGHSTHGRSWLSAPASHLSADDAEEANVL